jgi:hypothetical protein
MSNTLKVIDMIAKESLAIAHEKATFTSTVDRQFDESFGKAGEKVGSTLRVREPNQYTRRSGSRVMDVQDQNESTQTITLATQDGVDMRFNSAELSLNVDDPNDVARFSKRFIEPAMSVLVSGIDGDCLTTATKETYNLVGTAGTVVGSSSGDTTALGLARARLNQGLAPKDSNRAIQMDSITMASVVNANKGLFLPGDQIKTAFAEGYYGRSAMADFYENERTWTMANGSDVTGTTDAAAGVTDGGTTLSADTASPVTYTVGQVFTIAGVYACHPETKQSLGYLQQFTNTAGTGSGGDMTISPATYLTGAKRNVCSAAGAQLATTDFNSQTLTCVGAASTSYRQNLMYHRDAFAFVMADLPIMDDAHKCVVRKLDGFSIRVWMASDIRNDELLVRLDVLYGFKTFRPAWACRLTN